MRFYANRREPDCCAVQLSCVDHGWGTGVAACSGAAASDRRRGPPLLRARPADAVGRRVRRPHARAAGARGGRPRPRHAGLADAAGRGRGGRRGSPRSSTSQPMLSLANARNDDEFRRVGRSGCARMLDGETYQLVTEPKIDGLAISLVYERGVFVRGATRGQRRGRRGRDREPAHDPRDPARPARRAGAPLAVVEVRGEVYLPLRGVRARERGADRRGRKAVHEPAQLGGRLAAPEGSRGRRRHRPLSLWAYAIGHSEGLELESHWEALALAA